MLQCSVCHLNTGLKPQHGITEAATLRNQGECGERCGTMARCQCLFKGIVPHIGGEGGDIQQQTPGALISSVISTLITHYYRLILPHYAAIVLSLHISHSDIAFVVKFKFSEG